MCCYQGKISISPLNPPPQVLYQYLTSQDPVAREFRGRIRNYNYGLAMTSVGRELNYTINQDGRGPYTFILQGQLNHLAGSLLPTEGVPPKYAQLYIHDSEVALNHRLQNTNNTYLDSFVLRELQDMLEDLHPGVELYKQAHNLTRDMPPEQQCRIALRFQENTDRRRYEGPQPAVREIAVILPGDGDTPTDCQDIILFRKSDNAPRRIRDSHPFYPSLCYVLLFPTGQLQWHPKIPYQGHENQNNENDKYISLVQYFRYRLHIRPTHLDSNHLFLAGKLFQEYVCESWAITEQKRLAQLRAKQDDLRAEVYKGLADAVAHDIDTSLENLGKRIILPSSFSGSTRHMQQQCQDALAINRYFGGGDLFITMTANASWPEIQNALLDGQGAHDRPDLVVRVFHAKLQDLIKELKKGILGDMAGFLYTIEFQKRGLPHAHIILFLKPHAKLRTPDQIDSLMSSEFPINNPELLELIKKFMVHGPCGDYNRDAPCMVGRKCTKGFPKPFREHTSITDDSYARTRRSDTGQTVEVRTHNVDNRWVVCHSKYLIWKYRCHINIESIASVKAVKYIFKYVYKGHDRTTMEFGTCVDEIKQYLDSRYVSSCEANWRLYFFEMHDHYPSVLRLAVHLSEHQTVVINPTRDVNAQELLERHQNRDTTLTGWFKANALHQDGVINNTLYQDFPNIMVWNKKDYKWTIRKNSFQIGRMYYAHPSAGERFYLRLLLTVVKGATSYEELRSFEDHLYPSFREACIARGLLEDDNEWHQCLQEAKHMAIGCQMRHLFVTILIDCSPSNPRALWDTFWQDICDDLKHQLQTRVFQNRNVEPTEDEIQDFGLYLIDQLLRQSGRRLQDWDSMPQVAGNWRDILHDPNPLITEQRQYNQQEQAALAAECIANLNPDQHSAFDRVISAVTNTTGEAFFLHGPGGTGKTYLYNTLCYHLRSQNKIVLCVASSGIAALLLMGGRTAHSRFKLPIPCNETTHCNIPKNSQLAKLICETDLVIWDEAPMQHRHIMETVDRSFRDLRNSDKSFGGVTVVFGGDFQQILPVILKGSRAQVVSACIQRSYLWTNSITVLHLHQNMRLNTNVEAEANFAKWQFDIGHGELTDEAFNVSLPNQFKCRENTVSSLIDAIYPNINTPELSNQYFSERIILSPMNKDVNALNKIVLDRFPGPSQTFYSADFIPVSEQFGEGDPMLNYPVEHLNEINGSSLPLAKLEVKAGCPVMILKNLDQPRGVCNGSRGILTRYRNRVLEVKLITGQHAGETVFIPRIPNQPSDDENSFKFTRKQFPIRLCFSMTINKSQGQSVKHVGLDLSSSVFTHGQFYVAVSRVTSVSNIKAIWTQNEQQQQAEEAITKNIVYKEVLLNNPSD